MNFNVNELLSGAGAGAVACFFVCPLDVIKTRKQFDFSGLLNTYSTLQVGKMIRTQEGIFRLYHGVIPSMFGYVSAWSVYFSTYAALRLAISRYSGNSSTSAPVTLLSSVAAGFVSSTATSPIWVVRTRMMTNGNVLGLRQTAAEVWRRGGIQAFYSGLVPSYLGLFHVAFQFPLYERLKEAKIVTFSESLNVLCCSIISKLVATLATYPHEVLRTRLQTLKHSKYSCLRNSIARIWREEGFRGFYKGLSATLIRVIPTTAIIFVTHHALIEKLNKA